MNEANMKAMQTQIDMVKNELRNEMKNSIQASLSNQTNEIKNMMASLLQMNTASTSGSGSLPSNIITNPKGKLKTITTRSGLVIDGPTVPTTITNSEVDERVDETLTDPDLAEYTIKKMLKALLSNKEKLQELENTPFNENCSAVILKKLPKKLGDPEKFLIPCGLIHNSVSLVLEECTFQCAYSSIEEKSSITEYQLADLFTKALPLERFKYLVRRLGGNRLQLPST
nr:reverse transcriptase domain-containing protein [Tanacetum cinerariifolium]